MQGCSQLHAHGHPLVSQPRAEPALPAPPSGASSEIGRELTSKVSKVCDAKVTLSETPGGGGGADAYECAVSAHRRIGGAAYSGQPDTAGQVPGVCAALPLRC